MKYDSEDMAQAAKEQANMSGAEEPWTQKVRRAMNRFSQAMEKDGLNMTLEASAAYNELGGVLSGFVDAFESMQRDLFETRAQLEQMGYASKRAAVTIERRSQRIKALEDECVDHIMKVESVQEQANAAQERVWSNQREMHALQRRATEFQKAYESIAADTKAKDEQIADLKNQLDVANSVILSQSQQLPVLETKTDRIKAALAEQERQFNDTKNAPTVQDLVPLIKKAYEQPLEKCPHCSSTVGFDHQKACLSCRRFSDIKPADPTAPATS